MTYAKGMTIVATLNIAAILAIVFMRTAFAQALDVGGPETIPWGAWLSQVLLGLAGLLASIAGSFAVWVLHRLMQGKEGAAADQALDKAVENAVAGGIGSVANASSTKTMSVPIANQALRATLDWFKNNEPELVKKYGLPFLNARLTAAYSKLPSVPDEAALPAPSTKG